MRTPLVLPDSLTTKLKIERSKNLLLSEKATGAFLGAAVGDSLGRILESTPLETRQWLNWYKPKRLYKRNGPMGQITDDTQMSILVSNMLLKKKSINKEILATALLNEKLRGPTAGTVEFLHNFSRNRNNLESARTKRPENTPATRVIPVGIAFHNDINKLIEESTSQASVTHSNPLSIAGAVIAGYAVAYLLCKNPGSLVNNVDDFLEKLVLLANFYETCYENEEKVLSKKLKAIPFLLSKKTSPRETEIFFGSGVKVFESLPFSIYCFLYNSENFKATLLSSVNYSIDSDTCGNIACGFAGAYLGKEKIPGEYLSELERRNEIESLAKELIILNY